LRPTVRHFRGADVVVATSTTDPFAGGYPRSSDADLNPGPDRSGSLDDADRLAVDEHRVALDGRQTDGEGIWADADDVDDAEARH
jgi:hypothetical protein